MGRLRCPSSGSCCTDARVRIGNTKELKWQDLTTKDSTAGSHDADSEDLDTTVATVYSTGDGTLGLVPHGDKSDCATLLASLTESKDGPA